MASTAEKLFVEIVDRRNRIIEQVRQQTELFDQHLASKLLIEGVTPPAWLWNPTSGSDPKELSKEDLISGLLLPHRQPAAPCSSARYSLYSDIGVIGDNRQFSDAYFVEKYASSGQDARNAQATAAEGGENYAEGARNSISELDVCVASPQEQTDKGISSIYDGTDQSLAKFQRSKSRQKALELRNSVSAKSRNCPNHDRRLVSSGAIRSSSSALEHADGVNELQQLAEPCSSGNQSYGKINLDEDCQNHEKGSYICSGKISRSKSSTRCPYSVNNSSKTDSLLNDAWKIDCTALNSEDDLPVDCSNKSVEVIHPSNAECCDGRETKSGKRGEEKCQTVFPSRITGNLSSSKETTCHEEVLDTSLPCNHVVGTDLYTGRTSMSRVSSKHPSPVRNSPKADSFFVDGKKSRGIVVTSLGDIPSNYGKTLESKYSNISEKVLSPSDLLAKVCETHEQMTEEHRSNKEQGVNDIYGPITKSWSSFQHKACVEEDLNQSVLPPFADMDNGMFVMSSMKQLNASNQVSGREASDLVHGIPESQDRFDGQGKIGSVDRSSFAGHRVTMSKSSVANYEDHNSRCDVSVPCAESHDIGDLEGNVLALPPKEHFSCHLVSQQAVSSTSGDAKQEKELECVVARVPSDCFAMVKPTQLDFDHMEEYNQNFDSSPRRISSGSSQEMTHLSEPILLPDEETSDNVNTCLRNQLPLSSEVPSKGEKLSEDSFESDVNLDLEVQGEKCAPVINEHQMSNSIGNKLEAVILTNGSQLLYEADIKFSNVVDVPDVEIDPVNLQLRKGSESKIELEAEKDGSTQVGKFKCVSFATQCKGSGSSNSSNLADVGIGVSASCSIDEVAVADPDWAIHHERRLSPSQETQSLVRSHYHDESCNILMASGLAIAKRQSSLERIFRSSKVDSWPQNKRRKIKIQPRNTLTTLPSFRAERHCMEKDPRNSYLGKIEFSGDTEIMDALDVKKSIGMEMCQRTDENSTQAVESIPTSPNQEATYLLEDENEHQELSSSVIYEQFRVSSSPEVEARDSSDYLVQKRITLDDDRKQDNEQSLKNLYLHTRDSLLNGENLTQTQRKLPETKLHLVEQGLLSRYIVPPQDDESVNSLDVNQTMPVLEGFTVDAEEDSEDWHNLDDGIDFGKFNFLRTMTEHASSVAQIRESASRQTPLSNLSSSFKFKDDHNLFQSVPNGLLERLDLKSTLSQDVKLDSQLSCSYSCMDEVKNASKGMPLSDCLPYSGPRFGWSSRNRCMSPVGKLWERFPSHSSSSGGRWSSNPELTCFPIEEDQSISEENNSLDEVLEEIQGDSNPLQSDPSYARVPLQDVTKLHLNIPTSVSAGEKSLIRDTGDIDAKVSLTGKHSKVRQTLRSRKRNNSEAKENLTYNATNGAKESINNSLRTSNLSIASNSRRQDQKLSLKSSKHNNIVSNITSFIPLVQQKQATAVGAGKRDVKVKALEAAEAAKRLEEKKANERKMRKEELKRERAILEQENLRQIELENKKKEEERKKKDARIMLKKRQREEEERKEKEKKRMRVEEARKRHREQEQKLHAQKLVKEKLHPKIDESFSTKKEPNFEPNKQKLSGDDAANKKDPKDVSKKQQNLAKATGDSFGLKKTETAEIATNKQAVISSEECQVSCDSFDIEKKNQEKSYEISPYQCSDDEEEEEEDLKTKKYIPSWASKSSVALVLPSQQDIDPYKIFPLESCCSMDEESYSRDSDNVNKIPDCCNCSPCRKSLLVKSIWHVFNRSVARILGTGSKHVAIDTS